MNYHADPVSFQRLQEARQIRRAIRHDWKKLRHLAAKGLDTSRAMKRLMQHRAQLTDYRTDTANKERHMTTIKSTALACLLVLLTACNTNSAQNESASQVAADAPAPVVITAKETCYRYTKLTAIGAVPEHDESPAPRVCTSRK